MVCNSYLPRSPRSAIGKFGKVPDFSGIRRRSKRATPKDIRDQFGNPAWVIDEAQYKGIKFER